MAQDSKDLSRSLASDATHALIIGNKVFVTALTADGKPFVFSRKQMEFFLALQKMKSVGAAALAVDETEDWATRFLGSKKFLAFVAAKMQELSIKQGVTVEWWYRFGKESADGKRERYTAFCAGCREKRELTAYDVESGRGDDMQVQVSCPVCSGAVVVKKTVEVFKPSRENVEAWKELGSRLIPKVERIQHAFDKTEIVFETEPS